MKTELKFAFIQSGYCVFGAGATWDDAIADAAKWLEGEGGQQGDMTIDEVENLIEPQLVDGGFTIIEAGSEEFDSYMRNQGGYEQIDGKWYDAKQEKEGSK
jgi:hypothetical protein